MGSKQLSIPVVVCVLFLKMHQRYEKTSVVLTWKYIKEMCALALFNISSMSVINLSNSDSYFKGSPRDTHDWNR